MVFKFVCILVLCTKVASWVLGGLRLVLAKSIRRSCAGPQTGVGHAGLVGMILLYVEPGKQEVEFMIVAACNITTCPVASCK